MGALAERWLNATADKKIAESDKKTGTKCVEQVTANPSIGVALIKVRRAMRELIEACEAPKGDNGLTEEQQMQALMAQYKTARIVPGSVKPH